MPRNTRSGDAMFVAKESFVAIVGGVEERINKGDLVREGHAVLEGREKLFKPVEVQYDMEQATAAPGEKRAR
jgi:hypothetical protein